MHHTSYQLPSRINYQRHDFCALSRTDGVLGEREQMRHIEEAELHQRELPPLHIIHWHRAPTPNIVQRAYDAAVTVTTRAYDHGKELLSRLLGSTPLQEPTSRPEQPNIATLVQVKR